MAASYNDSRMSHKLDLSVRIEQEFCDHILTTSLPNKRC